jgi:hypothetical protein
MTWWSTETATTIRRIIRNEEARLQMATATSAKVDGVVVKAVATGGDAVDEQRAVLDEVEQLETTVTMTMLQVVKRGVNKVVEAMSRATAKVEMAFEVAAEEFRDDALAAVLTKIDERREKLATEKAKTRSKVRLEHIDKQLAHLDAREATAIATLGGEAGEKLISDKTGGGA